MPTPLSDPAFYLTHIDGEVLASTVVMPGESRRRTAFMVYSTIERLEEYNRLSGNDLRGFNIMAFETLEDVEQFVEQYRDFYEFVIINPELGRPFATEPFERLLDMARQLAVEG